MRELIKAIHSCKENGGSDMERIGIMMEENERPNNHRGNEINVILPDKDFIIDADTGRFLVLIAKDKKDVIMPKYLSYVKMKVEEMHKESGKGF